MNRLLDHPKLVVPLVGALTAIWLLAGAASARPAAAVHYPRAGVLLTTTLAAHAQPTPSSRVTKVFTQFRSDYAPTMLLVLGERRGSAGVKWLKVSTPMRPNGQFGWVKASAVQSTPVYTHIVVDISSRQLSLYDHNKLRYRTRTAVGSSQNPTPTGLFYVQARFHPTNSFLGDFAFETSAYAPALSEWPGGGLVGIHGTSEPQLIGQAVSHGCIRISNTAALKLKGLVGTGTPITIRQ